MYKVIGILLIAAALGAAGTSVSSMGVPSPSAFRAGTEAVKDISNVAVFQDHDPWGYTAITDILDAHSIPYTIYGMSDIGNVDLSQYDKVIIANQQDHDFYEAVSANSGWLEDYVNNGGCLLLELATYFDYDPTGLVFPFGISVEHAPTAPTYNNVDRAVPDHEVFNVPNPVNDNELDGWGYSSHGYFVAYPEGTAVLAINADDETPCMIEYRPAGTILAHMMPVEWAWSLGYSDIDENLILYCPAPTGVDEEMPSVVHADLAVSPSLIRSGAEIRFAVPEGRTASLKVYDAAGKLVDVLGTYGSGTYSISWMPEVSSGIYFISLEGEGFASSTRVLIER